MKRLMIMGMAVAMASVATAVDLRELTFQVAMPVKTAPKIDGALDDACWKQAVVHDHYYEYWKSHPKRVQVRTESRIVYDDKGIYTGVINFEEHPEQLLRRCTKNQEVEIWTDDCAELYYDPDAAGGGNYKFVVNANGNFDSSWRMDTANVDNGWCAEGIQCAAKVFSDRWEFELFIPWSAFHNRPKPEPGKIWMFDHVRYRYVGGGNFHNNFSTSSPGGNYANAMKFGYLYFSDGSRPDAQAILDLLSKRLSGNWAIQIGDTTYMHSLSGISKMTEAITDFVARQEAAEKAENAQYVTNLMKIADFKFEAPKLPLPLAGSYDLNPPKEYDGHNGWFRHNRVKDAYVTPHLDWRSTRATKKPRVLFLTNFGWGFRDAVELEQRFNMEAFFHPGGFGASGVYEDPVSLGTSLDKRRQFETLLAKDPDVFVYSTFWWGWTPERYRYEIIRRVRDEGKGLVLFGDRPGTVLNGTAKDMKAANCFDRRLPYAPKDKPTYYLFGKGRVVLDTRRNLGEWSLDFRGRYETRAAMRFSPIAWAAKIDPGNGITFADGGTSSTVQPTDRFLAFSASGECNGEEWRVRDMANNIVMTGKVKGGALNKIDVARLAPGEYALDVLDSTPIVHTIIKLSALGELTINSTNEILIAENAAVNLNLHWTTAYPEPLTLEWEIFDMPYRQVRNRGSVPVRKGVRDAQIRRPAGEFPTLAGFARAKLVDKNGAVVAQLDKMMFFPNHRFPDYTMTIWESIFDDGMIELLAPKCIEEFGYENQLGESGWHSAVFNGRAVPYVTRVQLVPGKNGTVWEGYCSPIPKKGKTKEETEYYKKMSEDVNIYKPAVKETIEKVFANVVKRPVKYGVSCWNLGDECYYSSDIGFGDEESEKIYRDYLAKRYGTIEKFNAAHKTNCASFAEAPHKRTGAAKKEGDWPAYADQMAYSAKMYADTFRLFRSVIKKFDPKARVGAEGSNAGDLEETVSDLEFWGPYRDLVKDEVMRNIAPDRVRGIWWGGYVKELRNGFPMGQWEFLLTGTLNSDLWYNGRPGSTESAIVGDYTLAPYVRKMYADHIRLKRGIAPLLINTPFKPQPFAFYYSHDADVASRLSEEFLAPLDGLNAFFHFCYRYGYDLNVVTPRTLNKLKKLRQLYLPGTCVLSDAEVTALKAFVKAGGKIYADSEPGVLDKFFARRAEAPLKGMWTLLKRRWTDQELKQLLAADKILPQAEVTGLDPEQTIIRVRELGDMRITGFKTNAKELGKSISVDLKDSGFVYETDSGFIGEQTKVEIAKLDKPFKLYSIFKKRQEAPKFALSKTMIAPGDSVEFETKELRKGSVYRLEVFGTDGKAIKNRERVFKADGKKLTFQFPYSDINGDYRVMLRDIATGLETSVNLTLAPAGANGKLGKPATLKLNLAEKGKTVPKLLWGAFFEDYGFGADGGLYAELVANRGFDLKRDPMFRWENDIRGEAAARISIQHGNPVHENTAAHVRIESLGKKPGAKAGVRNRGYFGIAVEKGKKYDLSLYLRGIDAFEGRVEVLLEAGGRELAHADFPASAFKIGAKRGTLDFELPAWTKLGAVMTPNATATDATLSLLVIGKGGVEADFISLYPQDTYKGRKGGLRRDLAELLEACQPAFLRFPGGCMLEGCNFQQWCDWKRTLGPLERRETVEGLWSWIATHGLGYYEYFVMCEDMKMEPLPVLIGAITCQFRGPQAIPLEDMSYAIENTLDFIEFANGAPNTKWGAIRSSMGHPEPFNMKMLAIGNENWGEEYLRRYDVLEKAIRTKYPKLTLVPSYSAGVDCNWWELAKRHFAGRTDLIVDEHYYQPADWFYQNADRYDKYDRNGPKIFIGEYASFDRIVANGVTRARFCLDNALGEAAMMTGYERNCDLVTMACFAPMYMRCIEGVDEFFYGRKYSSSWPGSMIWFDGLRSMGRSSYWVQKLFAVNRPDALVPFEQNLPRSREGIYSVCGVDRARSEYVIKVVNPGEARELTIDFGRKLNGAKVRETILTADSLYAENTLDNPTRVIPVECGLEFEGGDKLVTKISAHSLTVLRVPCGEK